MREIKFRVWDNVDYMSTPFVLQDLQSKKIEFTSDCPVMQFTGLKDKNGKEIYEGDIVRILDGNFVPEFPWTIVFSESALGYYIRGELGSQALSTWEPKFIEIIGNVFETPIK